MPYKELSHRTGYQQPHCISSEIGVAAVNRSAEHVPPVSDVESDPDVLFLSQPHLSRIGGMQRHSERLLRGLQEHYRVQHLPYDRPGDILRRVTDFRRRSRSRRATVVYCDAGISALLGSALFGGSNPVRTLTTVHGLDVVAPLTSYQWMIRKALRRFDRVVCVSRATAACVASRGVSPANIRIVPNAAEEEAGVKLSRSEARRATAEILGLDLTDKKVILSLGRPIKRKGFDRFVTRVFHDLPDNYVYVVAGPRIRPPSWLRAVKAVTPRATAENIMIAMGCQSLHRRLVSLSSHPRVFYLNGVSDNVKDALLTACDVFVLPNRSVDGDMEGFGIVALEAAVRGVPVVAFGIEGIADAVIDGENGRVVHGDNFAGMRQAIISLAEHPERARELGARAREFTFATFSFQRVLRQYVDLIAELR